MGEIWERYGRITPFPQQQSEIFQGQNSSLAISEWLALKSEDANVWIWRYWRSEVGGHTNRKIVITPFPQQQSEIFQGQNSSLAIGKWLALKVEDANVWIWRYWHSEVRGHTNRKIVITSFPQQQSEIFQGQNSSLAIGKWLALKVEDANAWIWRYWRTEVGGHTNRKIVIIPFPQQQSEIFQGQNSS